MILMILQLQTKKIYDFGCFTGMVIYIEGGSVARCGSLKTKVFLKSNS
jgi:hypothetical protein